MREPIFEEPLAPGVAEADPTPRANEFRNTAGHLSINSAVNKSLIPTIMDNRDGRT